MRQDTDATTGSGSPPDAAEIAQLLAAGAAAPSSHNTQPWRLRWHDGAVEVHGDPDRALAAADPDGRELRMACGAALANVRLTVRAQGRRAHVQLLPEPEEPWFFGRVRPGAALPPTGWEVELAAAIPRRHTDRHPFSGRPISAALREQLGRAAWRERCRLVLVDGSEQRRQLRELTAEAHRRQRADPAFVAEWERWIGHSDRVDDGLPHPRARHEPRPDDAWRLRDFAGTIAADERFPGEDPVEDEPTIAVVASYDDTRLAHVQAGQAMEQVLLTATARGLASSFVASPLEVATTRVQVRALLGGVLWPQMVLRLGRGRSVHPTPRRADTGD
ncbi:Acg family FMN-binding oxidoreductase [Actinomycetospora cinnamomea]|uniref:Nitroreductase family protein n=1 Tax=Actinomycetospora cinnamomea TaxID=663609 RepID=A0A2U1F276_9PSEU|nr:nitroreductase family protein [Actinomycetospora cinnamomea]PVZ06266.1 nitroreductase family protein [Actinomycetospora cinnamomea]